MDTMIFVAQLVGVAIFAMLVGAVTMGLVAVCVSRVPPKFAVAVAVVVTWLCYWGTVWIVQGAGGL